ncbi:hypothetical protein D3C83_33560 [compost metagenome]
MGVDTGDLRRDIGAHAEHAAGESIDQLERLKVQIVPRAREQRFDVLQQRRHHQLIAMHLEEVQQPPPQPLDSERLRRQDVFDVFR